MISVPGRKLGKLPKRVDARTLKLARYADLSQLPPIPPSSSWSRAVKSWPMFLNDRLGDCADAGAAHMLQAWNASAGRVYLPSDDDVLEFYEATTGYNPADPATDQGSVLIDVLNYWRSTGFAGHKIAAYVEVDFADPRELQAAIYLFGGVYAGVELPLVAQNQAVWGVNPGPEVKSRDGAPGGWGGHCVPLFDYWNQSRGDFYNCVTWGAVKRLTGDWFRAYASECYAIVTEDFLAAGRDAAGLDIAALESDLREVTA